MKKLLSVGFLVLFSFYLGSAQIHRVAEMNTEQIRALDKQKTVVILPGGVLEQHGPHLPSFTDGYSNEWITKKLAESIASRPGWAALVFPTIPLGHGGANEMGGKHVFPGTYSVRRNTLRAVFMDLATELGEQGFRWVFIVHGHGAPYHNVMLDQAGDFFRDTYGGRMVHLRGLQPTPAQLTKLKLKSPDLNQPEADKKENGALDLHAGFEETSRLLFVRPDLVAPVYLKLLPLPVNNPGDFLQFAQPNWAGYIGSPRVANIASGQKLQEWRATRDAALIFAIVDGIIDEREIPHFGNVRLAMPGAANLDAPTLKRQIEIEQKQRDWMKLKGIE